MTSAAEKKQYIRKLNELASRYGNLEDSTIRDILQMLAQTRNEINAQLAIAVSSSVPTQLRLEELRRNVDRLIAEFEARAQGRLRDATAGAYRYGGLAAIEPLQALGFTQAFYSPSKAQINILQSFTSDLITGITAQVRQLVDHNVRLAALGQISPLDAMKNITLTFGESGVQQGKFIVSGISAKAEADVRTELQRVFNLSNHSQMQNMATRIDGLLKRWIATGDGRTRRGHLEAHLKYKDHPIPVNEPYKIRDWRFTKKRGWYVKSTAELMYPLDPGAPPEYTVNCRCTQAIIHPEIGVIGSSLDGRVSAMMKRAEEMQT